MKLMKSKWIMKAKEKLVLFIEFTLFSLNLCLRIIYDNIEQVTKRDRYSGSWIRVCGSLYYRFILPACFRTLISLLNRVFRRDFFVIKSKEFKKRLWDTGLVLHRPAYD